MIDRRQFLHVSVSAAVVGSPSMSWALPITSSASIHCTPESHKEISKVENFKTGPRIGVIGVGGCGCNVVEHMIQHGVKGLEFIMANSFPPSMLTNQLHRMIQLRPLGRLDGDDPEYAFKDAEDAQDDIRNAIDAMDMLFIIVGMGGTTGSGAAPMIARIARNMGISTVGVAISPFAFEGKRRQSKAEKWMSELEKNVDSLTVLPNERMLSFLNDDCSLKDAFGFANDFVKRVVVRFAETIKLNTHGNLEFEDACDFAALPYESVASEAKADGTPRAPNTADLATGKKRDSA